VGAYYERYPERPNQIALVGTRVLERGYCNGTPPPSPPIPND